MDRDDVSVKLMMKNMMTNNNMKKTKKTPKKAAKKVAKKVVKKAAPKKAPQPRTQQLVIKVQQAPMLPTVTDLSEPMRDGKKLTVPKTWMSENQLTKILQRTPPQYVYKRPGKGGGNFDYVTVSYVQKALNYIFGWNWDFEIIQQGTEGGQVWVLGKLTVRGMQPGQTIVKTQYGRADIKFKRGTKEMLDYGNDLKGASSDALKKCASLLGIASDIYGKADYKEETSNDPRQETSGEPVIVHDNGPKAFKPGQVAGPDGEPVYVSSQSGDIISEAEYAYSMKMYGRALSKDEQKDAKPKK